MGFVNIEQRSQEWIELRKNHIGGSDASVLMGCNPWKNEKQLFEEKFCGRLCAVNADMQRGIDLEEEALEYFSNKIGVKFFPRVKIHDQKSWMMGSIDGLSECGKVGIELKCPRNPSKGGKVPEKYYWQCQHLMEVYDLDSIWYAEYFVDSEKCFFMELERNNLDSELLCRTEEKWYVDHMLTGMAPGSVLTEEESELDRRVTYYKYLRDQSGDIEEKMKIEKEKIDEILKTKYRDKKEINVGLHSISRVESKGSVQYDKIPQLQNVNLEDYRKESRISWRVS